MVCLQLLWLRTSHRVLWSLAAAACHWFHVSLFYMDDALLMLLLLKLYTDHAGITFIYAVYFLREMIGQVWGWAPLNLMKPPGGIRCNPFQGGNPIFSLSLCMYHGLLCLMFYIFNLFNIHVSPLYILFGLCAFVGRCLLCMLYHLRDLLLTLYPSLSTTKIAVVECFTSEGLNVWPGSKL